MKSIGEQIQENRAKKHLSQSDLATLLGVTRSILSQWECDIRKPQAKNLRKLEKVLGCEIHA